MKNLLIIILVALLVGGLYVTNPGEKEFVNYITNDIEQNKDGTGLEKMLESLFSRPIAKFLSNHTEINDYQLFSVYRMEIGSYKRTYLGVFDTFFEIKRSEE
ncbi:MAG: DUF4359 domain-containing protein [Bacteroidales bacterium]|nr:DUF4359 domain-containing protein [Bacteroidales bacterium]MCF8337956.1 DUF4359 domain-containing protein [Bacteroidales bacterium]